MTKIDLWKKEDFVPIIYKNKCLYVDGVLKPNTKSRLYKNNDKCPITYGRLHQRLYDDTREGRTNDIIRLDELTKLIDPLAPSNEVEWNEVGKPNLVILRFLPFRKIR